MEWIDYGPHEYLMRNKGVSFLRKTITKDTAPSMKYMLLNSAIIHGIADCVKYLIEIGAEYRMACFGINSPARNAAQYGRVEILQYLHSLGADPLISGDDYSTLYYVYNNGQFGGYSDDVLKTIHYLVTILFTDRYIDCVQYILGELADTGINLYRRPLMKYIYEGTINWAASQNNTYFAVIPHDIIYLIKLY